MDSKSLENRRPLAVREQKWVHWLARQLVERGTTPNQVSLASLVFAGLGGIAFAASCATGGTAKGILPVSAAVFIVLRLLCNLLDGVIAIEGGQHTPAGAIYNELPDRIADSLLLVAAGYATGYAALGWIAALLAVITAYARALGGALGVAQDFGGPMAKQHRMYALSVGCVLAAAFPAYSLLTITLAVIILGSVYTMVRRVQRLAGALNAAAGSETPVEAGV